jgi:hypothetical protein
LTVSDLNEPPWIRSYALTPKRLSDGGWVWLAPYEWRWERPQAHLPSAVNPLRIRSRKAQGEGRLSRGAEHPQPE